MKKCNEPLICWCHKVTEELSAKEARDCDGLLLHRGDVITLVPVGHESCDSCGELYAFDYMAAPVHAVAGGGDMAVVPGDFFAYTLTKALRRTGAYQTRFKRWANLNTFYFKHDIKATGKRAIDPQEEAYQKRDAAYAKTMDSITDPEFRKRVEAFGHSVYSLIPLVDVIKACKSPFVLETVSEEDSYDIRGEEDEDTAIDAALEAPHKGCWQELYRWNAGKWEVASVKRVKREIKITWAEVER